MFHSILVGVATLEQSAGAVETGLALARSDGAAIQLVHAVPLHSAPWAKSKPDQLAALDARALTGARQGLADPLEPLFADADGPARRVDDVLHVLPGPPAKVILERAAEIHADLVVLGSHVKRKVFDFGSTARAVLAKAPCAVLVQPGAHRPFRKLLVPVDLSEDSLQALKLARRLAHEHGARLVTLHCHVPPELFGVGNVDVPPVEPTYVLDHARDAAREEYFHAMQALDWSGLEHAHEFDEGEAAASILERQGEFDLIVMGTHGRTGLAAVVLGSVAYQVLKHAEVPVLAIRVADRKWLT